MFLQMDLDYLEHYLAHPFSGRGIKRTTIYRKIQNFVITDHQAGPYGLEFFTRSIRAFILMIKDHQNQSEAHPFFKMGEKGLQNADFQNFRKNRKDHY